MDCKYNRFDNIEVKVMFSKEKPHNSFRIWDWGERLTERKNGIWDMSLNPALFSLPLALF